MDSHIFSHPPRLFLPPSFSLPEIVERVALGQWPYLRPSLCPQSHSEEVGQLMQRCWNEDVNERPEFHHIKLLLRKHNRYSISLHTA